MITTNAKASTALNGRRNACSGCAPIGLATPNVASGSRMPWTAFTSKPEVDERTVGARRHLHHRADEQRHQRRRAGGVESECEARARRVDAAVDPAGDRSYDRRRADR